MAPRLEYHGVGVVVSALMRFIHPSEHIWNKYPNPLPSQHLENCTTICQEVKNVSRTDQTTNYRYCDVIDNHNSYRMHPLSMEETWMTMHWPNRVSCFLLAITMVDVQNAVTYFLNKPKMESLQSRRLIAKALINNKHLRTGTTLRKHQKRRSVEHTLTMVPPYRKFVHGRLTNCNSQYGKWKCRDCTKIIRTYCSCTPGLMYCMDCYGNHHADVAADDKDET